jgi:hypothetical protein
MAGKKTDLDWNIRNFGTNEYYRRQGVEQQEARKTADAKRNVARLKAAAKNQKQAVKMNKNMAKSELKSAASNKASGVKPSSTAPKFGDGQTRYNSNQPFRDNPDLNLMRAKERARTAGLKAKKINKIVKSSGRVAGGLGRAGGGAGGGFAGGGGIGLFDAIR